MTTGAEFLVALIAMALASFGCRIGGFVLMRFVRITPPLEAALRAIPLAVMIGIVAPVAAAGRPAELAALAVIVVVMKLTGKDVVAALAGVAVVAILRASGI